MTHLNDVLDRIREIAPVLRQAGVTHARVFGSVARGASSPDSDVDVLVDLDRARVRSLVDLAEIRLLLEEAIGAPVDIADASRLKPHVRPSALADAVRAF